MTIKCIAIQITLMPVLIENAQTRTRTKFWLKNADVLLIFLLYI